MKAILKNNRLANAVGTILVLGMLLSATGCVPTSSSLTRNVAQAGQEAQTVSATNTAANAQPTNTVAATSAAVPDISDPVTIELGDSLVAGGAGVSIDGNTVTITAGGVYSLSGTLANGQIVVDAADKTDVVLVLNGVQLACSTGAPLYIRNARNALLVLAEGTENHISDGETYTLEEGTDEPNAAIFSKADLQISGEGALIVAARYNDAITSKDTLTITGGAITTHSVGDGLRGRDELIITGGQIVVDAAGDALESNNDEDPAKGVVIIEGGTVQITAGQDGIEAQTNAVVRGGEITLVTGGGSAKSVTTDASSAKGIKAGADVTIAAGTLHIDSSDDAIHSNGDVAISGGRIDIASGDDGIHADATVTIDGGQIDIAKSYEGIEGLAIAIHEGTIHVVASDDGVNGAGGVDGSSVNGRPGQNRFGSGGARLDITGGYLAVAADGDGLDINGAIGMSGGVVIVNGPTNNGNGALDYDGGFAMSGGFLVAVGSAGMAQAPDASSTQHAVLANLSSALPAGTLVHLADAQGEAVLTFAPLKRVQSVAFSSPELVQGATYVLYAGGSATGAATDGLYSGGAYTGGTEVARLTLADIVTTFGSVRGGRRGPGHN